MRSDPELPRLPIPSLHCTDAGLVITANSLAAGLLERHQGDLAGVDITQHLPGGAGAWLALKKEGPLRDIQLFGERWVDLWASQQDEGGVLLVLMDASERRSARAELARLQEALGESERARERAQTVQRELTSPAEAPRMVGDSGEMLRLDDEVRRVAPSPSTVLIQGESGSGKELVARSIHARSGRAGAALVTLNCAAMPDTLLESELFGHERGAFTGADRRRLGKFELADGGTLFLDEIAELSPAAQAKLLRVLQDGTLTRVGGSEMISTDVRLIAASHRDLAEQVRRGRFREDLFFRLNVFRLVVPPLRDRPEDVTALADFFHERHARRMGRRVLPISERSVRRLVGYRWPGNVRELENTIERATLLAGEHDAELDVRLPETTVSASPEPQDARGAGSVPRDVLLDLTLEQLQRLQIMHALETTSYKVFGAGGAGEKLGLNPQTLLSRMDKLGIPRPRAMRRARDGR